MSHPHEDRLLLFAYGELPDRDAAELEGHLEGCASCRAQLERLERARVALAWARFPRRHAARWAAVGLAAAAAVLLAVVLFRARPEPLTLSLTLPRYTAPGLAPIDSLLTRLEQEKPYAIP